MSEDYGLSQTNPPAQVRRNDSAEIMEAADTRGKCGGPLRPIPVTEQDNQRQFTLKYAAIDAKLSSFEPSTTL